MHYNNQLICTILVPCLKFHIITESLYIMCNGIYLFTLPIWSSTRSKYVLLTTLTALDTCFGARWAYSWVTYFSTCMSPTSQCVTTFWSTWPCLVATALQSWWLVTTEAFSLNHLGTWRTWSWDTKNRITFLMVQWLSMNSLIIFRTVHFRKFLGDI